MGQVSLYKLIYGRNTDIFLCGQLEAGEARAGIEGVKLLSIAFVKLTLGYNYNGLNLVVLSDGYELIDR